MSIKENPNIQAVALTADILSSIEKHLRGKAPNCKKRILSDKRLSPILVDFVVDVSTLIDDIVNEAELPIYVIYEKPSDYPTYFVLRKFIFDKPTNEVAVAGSLEEIRKKVPKGLTCFDRHPDDDKNIVETWL